MWLLLTTAAWGQGLAPAFTEPCTVPATSMAGQRGWQNRWASDDWTVANGWCGSDRNTETSASASDWGQSDSLEDFIYQSRQTFDDFVLQTELRVTSDDDGIGVVFRSSNAGYYLLFLTMDDYPTVNGANINSAGGGVDGMYLYSITGTTARQVAFSPVLYSVNTVYDLEVVAASDQIAVTWNGAPVMAVSDGDHREGHIGMYEYALAAADFRNFTVLITDTDGDGVGDADDCNPSNPGTGATTWYRDVDGDGHGNPTDSWTTCIQPTGWVSDNTDCDDNNVDVFPGATERCNGLDDDCDGGADDSDPNGVVGRTIWYFDSDGDTYGIDTTTQAQCDSPGSDWVNRGGDCDDANGAVNPVANETCNGLDDDCDGGADDADPEGATGRTIWFRDDDLDTWGDSSTTQAACADPGNRWVDRAQDCDDTRATVNPDGTEVCNNLDDDCDTFVDDADPQGVTGTTAWYVDTDGDGWGAGVAVMACAGVSGQVSQNGDCDDLRVATNPAAPETCNSVDDNCDGLVDNEPVTGDFTWYADDDGDGYGDPDEAVEVCTNYEPSGVVDDDQDCDDDDPTVNPDGTELPGNLVDEDCDGVLLDPVDTDSDTDTDLGTDGFELPDSSSRTPSTGGSGDGSIDKLEDILGCGCANGAQPSGWWLALALLGLRRHSNRRSISV